MAKTIGFVCNPNRFASLKIRQCYLNNGGKRAEQNKSLVLAKPETITAKAQLFHLGSFTALQGILSLIDLSQEPMGKAHFCIDRPAKVCKHGNRLKYLIPLLLHLQNCFNINRYQGEMISLKFRSHHISINVICLHYI